MRTTLPRFAVAGMVCLMLTGCAANDADPAPASDAPAKNAPAPTAPATKAGSSSRLDISCDQFLRLSEDDKTTTIEVWIKARGIPNEDMPEYVAVGMNVMRMGAYCSQPEHASEKLSNLYPDPGQA